MTTTDNSWPALSGAAYPPGARVPDVPRGAINPKGDPFERAYSLMQSAVDLNGKWRASYPKGIAPDELQRHADDFARSDAAQAILSVMDEARQDAAASAAKVTDGIKLSVPATADAQGTAARYWTKTEKQLSGAKTVSEKASAIQELIASATPDQLNVLAEELPVWMKNNGVPQGSWYEDALAAAIPGLDKERADAGRKARTLAVLESNHAALQKAFASGTPAPTLRDPANYTDTGGGSVWHNDPQNPLTVR